MSKTTKNDGSERCMTLREIANKNANEARHPTFYEYLIEKNGGPRDMRIDGLGGMTIFRIYLTYDYPRIFACISLADGRRWLFAESDVGPDFCEWAAVPVTREQIEGLDSGKIRFREPYVGAQGYIVRQNKGDSRCSARGPSAFSADDIPN